MSGGRTYTQAEVDAILARAVERAHQDKAELSIDDLVQIGSELGISREAVLASAEEIAPDAPEETVGVSRFEPLAAIQKGAPPTAKASSPAAQIAAWRANEKKKWARGFVVYLVVNAFLAFVNLSTQPHRLWFLWCAAGWGLGVALRAVRVFFADEETIQQRLFTEQSRKKRRELRRERRRARREVKRQLRDEIGLHVEQVVSEALRRAVHSEKPKMRVRLRARTPASKVSRDHDEEDSDDFHDEEHDRRGENR